MTALRACENRRVRGVPSMTYPSNFRCGHPSCTEDVPLRPDGTPTTHHIFPRSMIGNSSYFVAILNDEGHERIVPHAVGLCGSGTTGHHGDVEDHRSWIKLEDDGLYYWYDRIAPTDPQDEIPEDWQEWVRVGPLNPQPGSREGKPKRKRLHGDERAKRKTISFRVPDDYERGSEVFDALLDASKDRLVENGLKADPADLTTYVALTAVMGSWLQG